MGYTNLFAMRVANKNNPLVKSNSNRLKSAMRKAAASMGTFVREYDDSDTRVSGWTGFRAKILLEEDVNKDEFLRRLKRECQKEKMTWGTSSDDDICPDEDGWANALHSVQQGAESVANVASLGGLIWG